MWHGLTNTSSKYMKPVHLFPYNIQQKLKLQIVTTVATCHILEVTEHKRPLPVEQEMQYEWSKASLEFLSAQVYWMNSVPVCSGYQTCNFLFYYNYTHTVNKAPQTAWDSTILGMYTDKNSGFAGTHTHTKKMNMKF